MAGYDPHEWFTAERDVRTFDESEFEYYFRVGKLRFVYDASSAAALNDLRQNERPDRVLFIMARKKLPRIGRSTRCDSERSGSSGSLRACLNRRG